jgi:hypothetical protein
LEWPLLRISGNQHCPSDDVTGKRQNYRQVCPPIPGQVGNTVPPGGRHVAGVAPRAGRLKEADLAAEAGRLGCDSRLRDRLGCQRFIAAPDADLGVQIESLPP